MHYRHDKYFPDQRQPQKQDQAIANQWLSYVRNLEIESSAADFRKLSNLVRNEEFYKQRIVGKTSISSYKLSSMFEYLKFQIQEEPNFLNRKGFEL